MELPVITILDFAKLAYYVYHDELIIKKHFPNFIHRPAIHGDHFSPQDLSDGFYEVMLCPLTQSQAAQGHPFYASFFVKVMDRKAVGAVIAIRGTVATCLDNIRVDVDCWWKQLFNQDAHVQVPKSYLGAAHNFYFNALRYSINHLNLHAGLQLFATGHSLGGAIAALLPAYCGAMIRSVTFNAPGIKHIPEVKDRFASILNFRASRDFVSAIDTPIGYECDVLVPECYQKANHAFSIANENKENGLDRLNIINDMIELDDFIESVLPQHSMMNLYHSLQEDVMAKGINATASCDFGFLECVLSQADKQFSPSHSKSCAPFRATK